MKLRRWLGAGVAVLAMLVLGVWLARDYIMLHIGGWTLPHIAANRPIAWGQGPDKPALPVEKRPPNIVLILADDMGFNDITFYSPAGGHGGVAHGAVPTPNIDSIGAGGVAFTNGYAGNATCAPSRAAIMTGRYPTRFGFEFTPTAVAFEYLVGTQSRPGALEKPEFFPDRMRGMVDMEHQAVPAGELTVAELLKQRGYHTLHFGKWHLGAAKGTRPEDQGFDESLGFMAGASMFLPEHDPGVVNSKQDFDPIDRFLWANLPYMVQYNGGERFAPRGYMTDYLTDEATKAIHANRNRPFFMYLAYNAIHTPLQATKADYDALPNIRDHRLRVYAAMVRNLDRNVGRVLKALRDEGLDANTLVIFTSDNGGAGYIGLPDINRPYRGWKSTFFEGGLHAPFFMRWPAQLPTGLKYDPPVAHIDIFATAAAAAGAALPTDRKLDGVNLLPFVTGTAQGLPHKALFWRSGDYATVLADGWKLQVLKKPAKVWLFDMTHDPTEQHNLAAAQPVRVQVLRKLLEQQEAQYVKPIWPSLLQAPVYIDHPLNVNEKPGDEFIRWDN